MMLETSPGRALQPSQIAERLTVTRATVTGLLKGLERDRLIVRKVHADDGRRDLMRLTERGRHVLRSAMPELARWHAAAAAELSPSERATLVRLVRKLHAPDG